MTETIKPQIINPYESASSVIYEELNDKKPQVEMTFAAAMRLKEVVTIFGKTSKIINSKKNPAKPTKIVEEAE